MLITPEYLFASVSGITPAFLKAKGIAALVLDEYVKPLEEKGVAFTYTPAACKALVAEAGSKFGARDLRRTIRKRVEDPLAERFVAGTLSGAVTLDAVEGRLELV